MLRLLTSPATEHSNLAVLKPVAGVLDELVDSQFVVG